MVDRELTCQEAKRLNKRLKAYNLVLFDNSIDEKTRPRTKQDGSYIFVATVQEIGGNEHFEVVIYPRAIYHDQGPGHWNDTRLMEKLRKK
jgi:hypothetical protein